jgi:uncharacterized membrane protein
MKLKQIGSNMTVLTLNNGTEVLFSYETPVAGFSMTSDDYRFFKTAWNWSKTTTRHINKYLNGQDATVLAQSEIHEMVD